MLAFTVIPLYFKWKVESIRGECPVPWDIITFFVQTGVSFLVTTFTVGIHVACQ